MLTRDALPNPLAESGRSLQKFVSTKVLLSCVGQFFLCDAIVIMLLLQYSAVAQLVRGRRREKVHTEERKFIIDIYIYF